MARMRVLNIRLMQTTEKQKLRKAKFNLPAPVLLTSPLFLRRKVLFDIPSPLTASSKSVSSTVLPISSILGRSSICPYDAVSFEQVTFRGRPESSNEQSSQHGETCLANRSPVNEVQAIEAAIIHRGGPALSENGLSCTPEETTHDHRADSGLVTPRADGGEASQDDARSISSSASDRTIVYTPRSSNLGSDYGDSVNGYLDTADVGNDVHFNHI